MEKLNECSICRMGFVAELNMCNNCDNHVCSECCISYKRYVTCLICESKKCKKPETSKKYKKIMEKINDNQVRAIHMEEFELLYSDERKEAITEVLGKNGLDSYVQDIIFRRLVLIGDL